MTRSVTVYAEIGGVRVFSHTVIFEPDQAPEASEAIERALIESEKATALATHYDIIPVHCEIETVSK